MRRVAFTVRAAEHGERAIHADHGPSPASEFEGIVAGPAREVERKPGRTSDQREDSAFFESVGEFPDGGLVPRVVARGLVERGHTRTRPVRRSPVTPRRQRRQAEAFS